VQGLTCNYSASATHIPAQAQSTQSNSQQHTRTHRLIAESLFVISVE